MSSRRRLLFISPRFLFPMNEGGKIRTASILRGMRSGEFHITLVSPAPEDLTPFEHEIRLTCDEFLSWPGQTRSRFGKAFGLASSLPVGAWSDRSAQGSAVIRAALTHNPPDVLVADFPQAAVLLPTVLDVPSVMFTHNVETEIFERHARIATGLWKAVWRNQVGKMDRFERDVLSRFESVIAVSARDGAALRRRFGIGCVEVIDTGVDLTYFSRIADPLPDPGVDGGTIVFTGIMDSPANIDGVTFLMDEVWPLVRRARPAARALIVGRNPSSHMIEEAKARGLAWEFTGAVADIRPWVAKAHVAVIPLRVGSGTRIKAFEAMAMGKPVVSTRIGVEGLPIEPGVHFVAADTAEDFAAAIVSLLADKSLRQGLSGVARTLVEARFSWATVARQFEAICGRAIASSAQGRAQRLTTAA